MLWGLCFVLFIGATIGFHIGMCWVVPMINCAAVLFPAHSTLRASQTMAASGGEDATGLGDNGDFAKEPSQTTTQDQATAAIAKVGASVVHARMGKTLAEYWWCTE